MRIWRGRPRNFRAELAFAASLILLSWTAEAGAASTTSDPECRGERLTALLLEYLASRPEADADPLRRASSPEALGRQLIRSDGEDLFGFGEVGRAHV